MKQCYIDIDQKCISDNKILTGKLGGTERFVFLLGKFLEKKNYTVDYSVDPSKTYDVAIYPNVKVVNVRAKKSICWAGSFHTDIRTVAYDVVIANSKYMLDVIGIQGTVIPACFDNSILDYKIDFYNNSHIITTSNPNRHYENTLKVSHLLNSQILNYTWLLTGGNKLYCEGFSEGFEHYRNVHVEYLGIVDRERLLTNLASSHVFCYPNFSDNSETQCVAAIEAAALGLPVVLPKRKPFTEILPENPYFVSDIEECAKTLKHLLNKERGDCYICDVSRYEESNVLNKLLKILEKGDD